MQIIAAITVLAIGMTSKTTTTTTKTASIPPPSPSAAATELPVLLPTGTHV